MAVNTGALEMFLPTQPVDKNVARFEGTFSIPAGAGTEGIFRIAHNQGQALLPVGYFLTLSTNSVVEPNYQYDPVVFHLACDATDIIVSYYKISATGGNVPYTIILVAK